MITIALLVSLVQINATDEAGCKQDDSWAVESNPLYYYKCLAPGVKVQLKCPRGEYFNNKEHSCVLGTAPYPQTTTTAKPVPVPGGGSAGGDGSELEIATEPPTPPSVP